MKKIGKDKYLIDNDLGTIYDLNDTGFYNLHGLFASYEGTLEVVSRVMDIEASKLISEKGIPGGIEFGNIKDVGKIQNYFHWFTISLTNYLRLVFFIEYTNNQKWQLGDLEVNANKKDLKSFINKRIKAVIPEVHLWRNKVGAHFSITDPRNDDNLSTLLNSVIPVGYLSPFHFTNTFAIQNKFTKGEPVNIPTWSITVIFDKIKERFFMDCPNMKFSTFLKRKLQLNNQEDFSDIKRFYKSVFKNDINEKKSEISRLKGLELGKKNDLVKSEKYFKESINYNHNNILSWGGLITIFAKQERYLTAKMLLVNLNSKKLLNYEMVLMYVKIIGMKLYEFDNAIATFLTLPEDIQNKEQKTLKFINLLNSPKTHYNKV